MTNETWTRRQAMIAAAAAGLMPAVGKAEERAMITRRIPSSGENLPVLGIGTYSVFDHGSTPEAIDRSRQIVDILLGEGGSVIDTSPMYNRAERVVGDVIQAGSPRDAMFIATKVWTDGKEAGIRQMNESARLMRTDVIDLMQVHNLRDTDVHMETIRDWQDQGRIRYNGLTHYTAGAHARLATAMQKHKPEFIQINYSLGEREAEDRVLPLAQDLGIAVLINRPYQSGRLFGAVAGRELPDWASEFASSWGQFFLKWIIGHPAVTCAIPATSKAHHMRDNAAAGFGRLPDQATRRRMVEFMGNL
ncbi:MAG: aldo/keto reductase [Woeseiaceae bacterium]|nr:aldo/keto reductase [Woeseiaceae bacterium]